MRDQRINVAAPPDGPGAEDLFSLRRREAVQLLLQESAFDL